LYRLPLYTLHSIISSNPYTASDSLFLGASRPELISAGTQLAFSYKTITMYYEI